MNAIKWAGLGCLFGGIFLLIGYGIYKFLEVMGEIHPIVRMALAAIVVGIVILLIALSFERYKEVKGEEKNKKIIKNKQKKEE